MDEKKNILHLEDRKKLSVTGVKSVIRFEEKIAELETVGGILVITGEELHLDGLNAEEETIHLSGLIGGIFWPEESAKGRRGLFRGFFS